MKEGVLCFECQDEYSGVSDPLYRFGIVLYRLYEEFLEHLLDMATVIDTISKGYGLDAPELDVYDCIYLDKEERRCKAYDKRPEQCKSTSCEKTGLTFEKVQEQKFDKKYKEKK